MAALLVALSVMAVLMSAAMPVWSQLVKREKEEELIWRGQQYARAIGLFQRKFANTFPPNVDVLVEQRFLRRKYKDPITGEDFQVIPVTGMPPGAVLPPGTVRPGAPQQPSAAGAPGGPAGTMQPAVGIQGVVSKSTDTSIKIYNGRTKYNEWVFVYLATAQRLGTPTGPQQPTQPGMMPRQPGARPPMQPGTQPPRQPGRSPFQPFGGIDRRPGTSGPPPSPQPFGPQPGTRPPGS